MTAAGKTRAFGLSLPDYPWEALAPYIETASKHPGGVINLSIGTPVDPTPGIIREALARAADAPGYPTTHGTAALREAISSWFERRRSVPGLDPADIMPTVGSKELVAWLPTLLGLGPGDVVVRPTVAYPTYDVGAFLAGATPVAADDLSALPAEVRARVRLVWVNSPANPTGSVLAADALKAIVDDARALGAVVASDECYAELGWGPWDSARGGTPVPSVLDPRVSGGSNDHLLAVYSLSKQSNLAGYRAAFVAGDSAIMANLVNSRKHAGMIVPYPVQEAMRAALADDAHVLPVNDLARVEHAPSQYVIVGSGKTATDACIWLLSRGVDPDAICWVRPRDPWMLNRAVVQPDPAIFLGMAADVMQAAEDAASLESLFLRLEDRGIMLRIDRTVMPTMAKTPTLATWELEQLRTLEHVVRRGHVETVDRGRLTFADGSVAVAGDALVVHCAADGLKYPPLVPVWRDDVITLQPIRAGFPCFGAALIGYVEATREDDDEKNRLCPPSPYAGSMREWARMTVLGTRAAMSFAAEPDIKAWSDRVALNPARVPPEHPGSPALDDARQRLATHTHSGLSRLSELT